MRLSFGLEQKLAQKQILAPRMIQSMELLQLPIQALEERIELEMSENPVLELSEPVMDAPVEAVETVHPDAPSESEKEMVVDESSNNAEDFERLLELDRQIPDYFDEGPRTSASRRQDDADRRHDQLSNIASPSETLKSALEMQLAEHELVSNVRLMCERIISSLDSNGYLVNTLEDLLPPDAGDSEIQLAHQALENVQRLEPKGVGARNLKECLLLQLEPTMDLYEELKTLISDHLDDLKENRLPAIQRKTGLSIGQIQEAWEELRRLNPKPGAIYNDSHVPTVTPDVFVDRDENGAYKVWLEETDLPPLRISHYYRERLMSGQASVEEKEFIKRKINAAQWLIESIEQRRNTLRNVSQAIVDHQTKYLDHGPESIEPLKMQQIADKVKVHVTTVSRAVDDKWIQTPRGLLSLRKFFVGGTMSEDGEEVAWDAVRIKLQELVEGEDKSHPHSDDVLVKLLKGNGISVARRTVTKYRKKMGIPSSRQRRDWSAT